MENKREQKLNAWINGQVEEAVRELLEKQVISSVLVEAKPAWVYPFQILIGKIREQGEASDFSWFICGGLPTDHAVSTVASTPREVAKYFALRWQLEAERQEGSGSQLVEKAEALYELADEERLWVHK